MPPGVNIQRGFVLEKCWHHIPNCTAVHMVFQVRPSVLLFHIVLSRCCSSRPDLCLQFAKLIKHGAYGGKNFRINTCWAVYRVEHIVHFSLQILLCRVPSCEENLVEDRITLTLGCQSVKTRLPFRNFQILLHQWQSNYFGVETVCCDAHSPPHSRHPNSMDRTMNVEVRHLIFLNKISYLLFPNMLRLLFWHAWRDEGKE